MSTHFAVLACLLLSGCIPYWYRSPMGALPECQPVIYASKPFMCGNLPAQLGCTYRRETCAWSVVLKGENQVCIEAHEKRHRDGWDHDARPTYRLDCGND